MPTLLKLHETKEKEQKSIYKEDGEFITLETFGAPHDLQSSNTFILLLL